MNAPWSAPSRTEADAIARGEEHRTVAEAEAAKLMDYALKLQNAAIQLRDLGATPRGFDFDDVIGLMTDVTEGATAQEIADSAVENITRETMEAA
ncbi:MAG: hypothetical protein AAF968_06390 [Pseudomonadota bacterium]